LTLKLRNNSGEELTRLDVRLHSLDTSNLMIWGTGNYLIRLEPNAEETLPFQVSVGGTAKAYATISCHKEGEPFYWESTWIEIEAKGALAELESVFALTEPHTPLGKVVKIEATVKGLKDSEGLDLEFWADAPSGKVEALAKIEIERLSKDEEQRYLAEITPKENGLYTIHAYMYHENRRIAHDVDMIFAEKK